jgi:hypothetical protein
MDATGVKQHHNNREDQMDEFPTCYIKVETTKVLDSQEVARADEHFMVIENESSNGGTGRVTGAGSDHGAGEREVDKRG